jgi:gamma-glutamyl-gamma-aminobutyrate hydrolase PuuD
MIRLLQIANEAVRYADGIKLPGGEDIEPELYGEPGFSASPALDPRRTIQEYALIFASKGSEIPVWGTCRGHQMLLTFFGGKMGLVSQTAQHSLEGTVKLKDNLPLHIQQYAANHFDREVDVRCLHNQAVKETPQGFHMLLEKDRVPEWVVSQDLKYQGTQFHPETYASFSSEVAIKNRSFYVQFLQRATAFKMRKANTNTSSNSVGAARL